MSKAIPRFLYHLTTKANYESIMQSGFLKTSRDRAFGKGIFTTELTNFFKRWRRNPDWGAENLQSKLLEQAAKGSSELVILKIPTESLNIDNLKIRSQNKLFGEYTKRKRQLTQKLKERHSVISGYCANELIKLNAQELSQKKYDILEKTIIEKAIKKFPPPEADIRSSHLTVGIPAKERKLFQRRKEAIEYIYREDIPTSQIEKIGEVNVDELRKTAEYDALRPMRSIFSALLRGTPQEKGALLLNC